jgi:hypothetical protein
MGKAIIKKKRIPKIPVLIIETNIIYFFSKKEKKKLPVYQEFYQVN